jgi:hypothetical protein
MFRFVARRLRWLARVPGAPQVFDALLVTWTALFHRDRLAAMEAIEAGALRLPGVALHVHRFGGVEFGVSGRELGHLHGNGLLDVRVGRKCAETLVGEGRAQPHHVLGESTWISFWVRSMEDVTEALEFLKLAQPTRLPPTDRSSTELKLPPIF